MLISTAELPEGNNMHDRGDTEKCIFRFRLYLPFPLHRKATILMKLKNILIVAKDIESSKAFYKELFGLHVVSENDGNVILTEGLVLQDAALWESAIGKKIIPENHASLLYFEETNMDGFLAKLNACQPTVTIVTPLTEFPWGAKMLRFYDFDGNLIEVRSPM